MQIVAIEEQWLRKILSNIENEIELSMFTLEDAELKKNVREKIDNLLDIIYNVRGYRKWEWEILARDFWKREK